MTLISRLEEAESGSREHDRLIHCQVTGKGPWLAEHQGEALPSPDVPYYTTSLDSALILVPEEWGIVIVREENTGRGRVMLTKPLENGENEGFAAGYRVKDGWPLNVANPILGVVVAALKARQEMGNE